MLDSYVLVLTCDDLFQILRAGYLRLAVVKQNCILSHLQFSSSLYLNIYLYEQCQEGPKLIVKDIYLIKSVLW